MQADPGLRENPGNLLEAMMPGPRICPSRYLALLEMKMAIAILLGRFDIDSVDTPDGMEAQERLSLTMAPVGLTMRLREQS